MKKQTKNLSNAKILKLAEAIFIERIAKLEIDDNSINFDLYNHLSVSLSAAAFFIDETNEMLANTITHIKNVRAVSQSKALNADEKSLFASILVTMASNQKHIEPSFTPLQLARATKMSEADLLNMVSSLKERGFLHVEKSTENPEENLYWLLLDNLK